MTINDNQIIFMGTNGEEVRYVDTNKSDNETKERSQFLDKLKIFLALAVFILYLSLGIYAAITSSNNKPNSDSNGLVTASYVVCIIQSVIYLLGCIYFPIAILISDEEKINENANGITPLLMTIYWMVIFFNYSVSDDYDKYAEVQTAVFFTILGIFLLGLIICCCFMCNKLRTNSVEINNI